MFMVYKVSRPTRGKLKDFNKYKIERNF